MSKYQFNTEATINSKKWWIDKDIVPTMVISANTLNEAVEKWAVKLGESPIYISISKNALKEKSEMFYDDSNGNPHQIGYVIKGKVEMWDEDNNRYYEKYVDLWTEINELVSVF